MAPRVLIFVVAYNAERTIQSVLERIPESLSQYHTEILIIDDSSKIGPSSRLAKWPTPGFR